MRMRTSPWIAFLFLFGARAPGESPAGVFSPPDALRVEGVPPVPESLAETASRYTEFRTGVFTSWHPKRREMLIATRFGNTVQAHLVKAPGAARTQLTFYPDRVNGGRFDPVVGETFLFSKDVGGDEKFQIYAFDVPSGRTTLLTDGKSRNTGAVWSRGGDRVAYGSTRRTGNDVDLYVVDAKDPKTDRRLAELSGGGWSVADWSPDDRRVAAIEAISVNESSLWLFDVASGAKTLLTPKGSGEKVSWSRAEFSPDGRGLYVTTDRDSEFRRLGYLAIEGGRLDFLTPDSADVDGFDVSPDGSRIAFVTNDGGESTLHLLDAKSRREIPAPKLPRGVAYSPQWHPDGSLLGLSVGSIRSPYDAYSVDVASGKIERWTFSETGGVDAAAFAEAQPIAWKSFDGREITGFLCPPPSSFTGKRPVIIDIHGGPEGQERPDFRGRENYFINELGIAMIFPNIRGSAGYGKTFLKLDNGDLREGAYKDIGALFDWIATRPDLDASRIMVQGGSYGGHMTLAVATLYSDRIRCAVDVVGISHLVTFLQTTSGYRRDLRRVEYGDERDPKMKAFLDRTAPLNNAEKIRKPLFVIQGANDPRVPRTESEQMVQRIRKVGTPVWYLVAADEGHGFQKKSNRDFEFYATVLFVEEFLLK